jgi:hypothetical protein
VTVHQFTLATLTPAENPERRARSVSVIAAES